VAGVTFADAALRDHRDTTDTFRTSLAAVTAPDGANVNNDRVAAGPAVP
jgi:hypothetical protein